MKYVIKNNFRILKKAHAHFQTTLKAPVKFQKDRFKTVGGVVRTICILPIHFCDITAEKKSKSKLRKKLTKYNFRILKIQTILKALLKFQKDWPKTVGGVARTRCIFHIHLRSISSKKSYNNNNRPRARYGLPPPPPQGEFCRP